MKVVPARQKMNLEVFKSFFIWKLLMKIFIFDLTTACYCV